MLFENSGTFDWEDEIFEKYTVVEELNIIATGRSEIRREIPEIL